MSDSLRDRIAAAVERGISDTGPGDFGAVADAVIAELGLGTQWRADFGYDGYAKCDSREEAQQQVGDFIHRRPQVVRQLYAPRLRRMAEMLNNLNTWVVDYCLGDDIRDGEQAMVMRRYVTDLKADDE